MKKPGKILASQKISGRVVFKWLKRIGPRK
jgi:hypothetical protein